MNMKTVEKILISLLFLFKFMNKNMLSFGRDRVLVNLGPGKFSSIRTSISILKALKLIYKFKIHVFDQKMLKYQII